MKSTSWLSLAIALVCTCGWYLPVKGAEAAEARQSGSSVAGQLVNALIRADFDDRGLVAIHNLAAQKTLGFTHDDTALFLGDEVVDTEFQKPELESSTATSRTYRLQSGRWTARIIYELQPEWHFLTKRVEVTADGDRDFRVRRLELLRGQLATAPEDELRQRETTFLRYPGHGVFLTLQNPFGQWKRQGERCFAGLSARHDLAAAHQRVRFRPAFALAFTRLRARLSPPG